MINKPPIDNDDAGDLTIDDSGKPITPPLGLRRKAAALAIGISERKLWEITKDSKSGIPFVRLGNAVIYPVRELRDWLAKQPKQP